MPETVRSRETGSGKIRVGKRTQYCQPDARGTDELAKTAGTQERPSGGGIVLRPVTLRNICFTKNPRPFNWTETMMESFLYDVFPIISETFDFNIKKISPKNVSLTRLVSYVIRELKSHSNNKIEYILGLDNEERFIVGKRTFLTSFDNGYCFDVKDVYSIRELDPQLYRAYLAICSIIDQMGGNVWDQYLDIIVEPLQDMIEDHREQVRLGNIKDDEGEIDKDYQEMVQCYTEGDAKICMTHIRSVKHPESFLNEEVFLDPRNEIHQELIPIIELALKLYKSKFNYQSFIDPFSDDDTEYGLDCSNIFGVLWDVDDAFTRELDEHSAEAISEYGFSNMCTWEKLTVTSTAEGSLYIDCLERMFELLNNHTIKIRTYAENLRGSIQDVTAGDDSSHL